MEVAGVGSEEEPKSAATCNSGWGKTAGARLLRAYSLGEIDSGGVNFRRCRNAPAGAAGRAKTIQHITTRTRPRGGGNLNRADIGQSALPTYSHPD